MNQPSFSICIPNYNYARYIRETIQSVLDQTYPHFEIVVADNASTDNSIDVINSFQDERIRLIRNRYNIGFAPNLQIVAREARKDFLILLSSDDRMLPTALEVYSEIICSQAEKASNSIIYSEAYQIDGVGNRTLHAIEQNILPFYQNLPNTTKELSHGNKYYIYQGKDVLREAIKLLSPAGPFLTMAYPKALFEYVEGYNTVHLTDPDVHFTFKVLQQFPEVIWVRDSLFEYRVHENNQLGIQLKQSSIKKQIDKYLYTVDLPDDLLRSLDLNRQAIVETFVKKYLITEMFHYLARGNFRQAYSSFMFGLATYPLQVMQTPRAYGLAALLCTGPLSAPITRLLRSLFRSMGGREE